MATEQPKQYICIELDIKKPTYHHYLCKSYNLDTTYAPYEHQSTNIQPLNLRGQEEIC